MGGLAAILFLPVLAYILVQTGRDVRAKAWPLSLWGILAALTLLWVISRLITGAQY